MCEAVGSACRGAVGVAVRIVEHLYEAPRGDVVAAGGDFEDVVVGQRASGLYETFAEGALAYDDGAVEVLERAGENFGSRSRGAVDEYSQRYFEVEWLSYSFIDALVARVSASGAQNFGAFGHEVRGNLYGTLEEAAAVRAKVYYNTLKLFVCEHAKQRLTHAARAAFVESGETEVSDTGGVYAEVGQRVDVDVCAGDSERQ